MSESKNLCHLLLKVFDWNNWKKKTTGGQLNRLVVKDNV